MISSQLSLLQGLPLSLGRQGSNVAVNQTALSRLRLQMRLTQRSDCLLFCVETFWLRISQNSVWEGKGESVELLLGGSSIEL